LIKCEFCGKESDDDFPSGWYAICGGGGQFDTSECIVEYAKTHKLPRNTQWVRWK